MQSNLPLANQAIFNSHKAQMIWDSNAFNNHIGFFEGNQQCSFGMQERLFNHSNDYQNQRSACPICRQDIQIHFMRMGQSQLDNSVKCIQNPFTKQGVLFHSACLEHLHQLNAHQDATPPSKSKSLPFERDTFSEAILTETKMISKTKKNKQKRRSFDMSFQRQLNDIFLEMIPRFQTGVQPPFRHFMHQMPTPKLRLNVNDEVCIEIKIFKQRSTPDLENTNLNFDLCGRTKFQLRPQISFREERFSKMQQSFTMSQEVSNFRNWFHLQFNLPLVTPSQIPNMNMSIPKQQNLIDGQQQYMGSQMAVLQSTQYSKNQYRINSQNDDTLIIEYTIYNQAFGTHTYTGAASLRQIKSYQNTQYPWISMKVPSLANLLSKVMNVPPMQQYTDWSSDTVFLHFAVQTRRMPINTYDQKIPSHQQEAAIPFIEESIFQNLSIQIELAGDLSNYYQLFETQNAMLQQRLFEQSSAQQCLLRTQANEYRSGFSEVAHSQNKAFYPPQALSTTALHPMNPLLHCQQQSIQIVQPCFSQNLPQTTSVQQHGAIPPTFMTNSYSSEVLRQQQTSAFNGRNMHYQQSQECMNLGDCWGASQINSRSLDQWEQQYCCYKNNQGINQQNVFEVHTIGNFSSGKVLNNPQLAFQIQEIHNQVPEGQHKTSKQISTQSPIQESPSKQYLIRNNNYSTRLTLLDSTKSSSIQNEDISVFTSQMIPLNYEQQHQKQFYEFVEQGVSHKQHHWGTPSSQVDKYQSEIAATTSQNSRNSITQDSIGKEREAVDQLAAQMNVLNLEKGQNPKSHGQSLSSRRSDSAKFQDGKEASILGQKLIDNNEQELKVESDDSLPEMSKNITRSEEASEQSEILTSIDNLVSEVQTQKGSRNWQSIVKTASQKELSLVVERVQEHIDELMIDLYGNYFCQTLFRTISFEQRSCLLEKLKPNFVKVSCHSVGTHAMQRLLDVICEIHEKATVFESIKNHIDTMAFDHKGNFVLIKIMLILNTSDSKTSEDFIIKKLLPHISELINDQQGVCIVNKMIECATDDQHKLGIIDYLVQNLTAIMTNTFANYAVTTAFDTWGDLEICEPLVFQLKENLQQFAIHQTSANVIEKCVERANMKIVVDCLEVLEREGVMKSLLKCPHTFFIIFKIYNRLESFEQRLSLSEVLNMNIQFINDKTLREKCLALVAQNGQPVSCSQPSSSLLKANTSKLSKRQIRKQQKFLGNTTTTTEQDESLFNLLQELEISSSHKEQHHEVQPKQQRKNVKNGFSKGKNMMKETSSREEFFTQASSIIQAKSKNAMVYAEEGEQPQDYGVFDFQNYDEGYQYSRDSSYQAQKTLKSSNYAKRQTSKPQYTVEESYYYGYSEEDFDYLHQEPLYSYATSTAGYKYREVRKDYKIDQQSSSSHFNRRHRR